MPLIRVADLNDPRLAIYRDIKASNQTRGLGQFVVEGEKLVERLAASRFPVESVLVVERLAGRAAAIVGPDVQVYVPGGETEISDLVGFRFHRGMLAAGRRLPQVGLKELLPELRDRRAFLICPEINNPENLGAIIRLGDVFGIDAILAGPRCPDVLSRRICRVSMGTNLALPVLVADDLEGMAERLRDEWGFELLSSVVNPAGAEPLESVRPPKRFALVLGSEGEGLSPDWVARCGRRITIPMRPGAESLNVAVAAGILLYHLTKARGRPE